MALFIQTVVALTVSAGFAYWIPMAYLAVAVIIASISFLVLMTTDGGMGRDKIVDGAISFGLALVLGAIWPSVPLIAVRGAARARECTSHDRDLDDHTGGLP